MLGKYANKRKLTVDVLVEINVGQNRTGVLPGEPAAKLASEVSRIEGLNFKGLMGYEGFLQLVHTRFWKEKDRGSKGAVWHHAEHRGGEKSRAGSGDRDLRRHGHIQHRRRIRGGERNPAGVLCNDGLGLPKNPDQRKRFRKLTLHPVHGDQLRIPIVSSRTWAGRQPPSSNQIFGWDGMPHLVDGKATYSPGGDEHGILHYEANAIRPNLGDRLKFIPSHCDTTLNLYSKFYGVRGDRVEVVCPIAKR